MHHSFRDMEVWQIAHNLSLKVFDISKQLPKAEDYALTSQLRRASNIVSANMAEAFGRKTKKDKSKLYIISRGSAFETQNHLLYGNGVGYFNADDTNKLLEEYDGLIHQLNKIMKSLE